MEALRDLHLTAGRILDQAVELQSEISNCTQQQKESATTSPEIAVKLIELNRKKKMILRSYGKIVIQIRNLPQNSKQ